MVLPEEKPQILDNQLDVQLNRNINPVTIVKPEYLVRTKSSLPGGICLVVVTLFLALDVSISSALLLNRMLTRETMYFLILPSSSPEKIDFRQFQSSNFQTAHPNLILLRNVAQPNNTGLQVTMTPICYLCPETNQVQTQGINTTRANSRFELHDLKLLMKRLNSQGYGKPAFVDGIGSPTSTVFIRNLELSMKTNWTIGYTVKVLLGILSSKMNFTMSISTDDLVRGPRLHVCNHCEPSPPSEKSTRYGHSIMHIDEVSFFYCTEFVTVNSASAYSFLLAPFDILIWVSILGHVVLIALIFRSPWFALNIFWGLLGIPYLKAWRKSKVLVIVSLSLLVLQFYYVAFFTSEIILPFQPVQVETNHDLFVTRGYRYVRSSCDKASDYEAYVQRHNKSFLRFKINPAREHFLLIDPACEGDKGEFYRCGKFVGKAADTVQTKFTKQRIAQVGKVYPAFYCNVVKERWDVVYTTMNYDSHMSQSFGESMTYLQSGGIDLCFERIFMAGAERQGMSGTKTGGGGNVHGRPASGHLFSLLKLCGVMFTVCGGCLIGEILVGRKFISRWKNVTKLQTST